MNQGARKEGGARGRQGGRGGQGGSGGQGGPGGARGGQGAPGGARGSEGVSGRQKSLFEHPSCLACPEAPWSLDTAAVRGPGPPGLGALGYGQPRPG